MEYNYSTGIPEQDIRVRQQMHDLLSNPLFQYCSAKERFDEETMFVSPKTQNLKDSFREKFRNISRIIDCVGCERCKLYGKLQVLGIGTALKILFARRPLTVDDLHRNEVIALVNTLGKFSHALHIANEFTKMAPPPVQMQSFAAAVEPSSTLFSFNSFSLSFVQVLTIVTIILAVLVFLRGSSSGNEKQKHQ